MGLKAHTDLKFLHLLIYVGTHCYPNLLIVKVGKLHVCRRLLFANPVTYCIDTNPSIIIFNITVGLLETAQDTFQAITRNPRAMPQNLLLAFPTTKESGDILKFKKKESGTSLAS